MGGYGHPSIIFHQIDMGEFELKVILKIQKSQPLKLFITHGAFIKCFKLVSILKCVQVYIFS